MFVYLHFSIKFTACGKYDFDPARGLRVLLLVFTKVLAHSEMGFFSSKKTIKNLQKVELGGIFDFERSLTYRLLQYMVDKYISNFSKDIGTSFSSISTFFFAQIWKSRQPKSPCPCFQPVVKTPLCGQVSIFVIGLFWLVCPMLFFCKHLSLVVIKGQIFFDCQD